MLSSAKFSKATMKATVRTAVHSPQRATPLTAYFDDLLWWQSTGVHQHRRGLKTWSPASWIQNSPSRRYLERFCTLQVPRHSTMTTSAVEDLDKPSGSLHSEQETWSYTQGSVDKSHAQVLLGKQDAINKQIIILGKIDGWRDILVLYHEMEEDFNASNYSTVMSELGRIASVHLQSEDQRLIAFSQSIKLANWNLEMAQAGNGHGKAGHGKAGSAKAGHNSVRNYDIDLGYDAMGDLLFKLFYSNLSSKFETFGTSWMGARAVANILHDIATMDLVDNKCTETIFRVFDNDRTASLLFEHGNLQDIVNSAWACASLGTDVLIAESGPELAS